MKSLILLLLTLTLCCNAQEIPPENFWPKKVKVTEPTTLSITISNGRAGMKVPANTEVDVVSFNPPQIKIRRGSAEATIPVDKTDFLSIATAAYEAESRKKAQEAESLEKKKTERDAALASIPKYSDSDMQNAYYTARKFIQNALKSPSSAKFSNLLTDKDTTKYFLDASGRIVCTGIVDAPNSFGVPLRQAWRAHIQMENKTQWRVVYALLANQTLIDTRKENLSPQEIVLSNFIGMTLQDLKKEFGEPIEVKTSTHPDDGQYSIVSFSKEKDKETFFTIWETDGNVSSGMYQGMYLPTK